MTFTWDLSPCIIVFGNKTCYFLRLLSPPAGCAPLRTLMKCGGEVKREALGDFTPLTLIAIDS